MLSDSDGKKLIELARASILAEFSGKPPNVEEFKNNNKFNEKQGAFVTLKTKKNMELRGCIGFTAQLYPLYKTIILAAKAAAFEDPRFPAVQEPEMKEIHIDISVLTVPEEIKLAKNETRKDLPKHVEIGKTGLIVQAGFRSGLLLPQVFTEWNADQKTALEMTCQKAGLPQDAWLKPDCKVLKFQAQVFEE